MDTLYIKRTSNLNPELNEIARIEHEYKSIFKKEVISFLDIERSKQLINRWKQLKQ